MEAGRAEEARALMLALFPAGFEEAELGTVLELAAYTDFDGEERMRHVFGTVDARAVAADWAERWREFHRSVRVGRLWVGPPWEHPPTDAVAVVIDPGRAFGTGAHPTTRLCLELISDREPTAFLDVGCGSGVLAIAAAQLGYLPVLAVDVDEAAVAATRANAARNGVAVEARVVHDDDELPPSVVAVANISREAAVALAPRLEAEVLVTSGYLAREQVRLHRWRPVERRTLDGWAADVHRLD